MTEGGAYREDNKKIRHTGKTMVNESGNDGEEGQCLYDGDFEPPRPLAAILRDAKRANSPATTVANSPAGALPACFYNCLPTACQLLARGSTLSRRENAVK